MLGGPEDVVTSARVTDPNSIHFGKTGEVTRMYIEDYSMIVKFSDTEFVRFASSQLEFEREKDWDMRIDITGNIPSDVWDTLKNEVWAIQSAFVGAGTPGEKATMRVRFQVGQASKNMPKMQELAEKYGLVATRREPAIKKGNFTCQ